MSTPDGIAKIVTQEQAVNDCLDYMERRMNGDIPQYKTRFPSINRAVGGSFEPNTIITIGGVSGSGKSSMSTQFIYSFIENMHAIGKEAVALRFNFEMLAFKTVGREISSMYKRSTGYLYSQDDQDMLTPADFDKIRAGIAPKLKKKSVYYVEEPENPAGIIKSIYYYWQQFCEIPNKKDKLFIAEIDHALLIDGNGEEDKDKIDKLMRMLIVLKKRIQRQGGFALFIVLSQLNRDIESVERVKIPNMHRPMKKDLSSSDWMFQGSDYVIIGHMPSKLNLQYYTERKLPVKIFKDKSRKVLYPFIYYHVIKNRDGAGGDFCPMIGNLANYEFIEVDKETFRNHVIESDGGTNDIFMDSTNNN